jgi:YbbR-like protein
VSWGLITESWRLKLLALGLAVLMLGAVAFSQNPPTTKSMTVPLSYTVPPNVVLINPPRNTTVIYSGLADVISRVDASNMIASVDATRAQPGTAVRLNILARSLLGTGVQVQSPAPIAVTVDTRQVVDRLVQVNARSAPGWNIDPSKTAVTCPGAASANPCRVHFDGPLSWQNGLKAVATVPDPVTGTNNFLNRPVVLQNAGGPLDLSVYTVPTVTLDVDSVDIHMEAVTGVTSAPVPLVDSQPIHPPPAGYRVTAIIITPLIVTISGDPAAIARVRNIALPAVDLSKSTSDATFTVPIPYPNGVSSDVQTATIKYSISPNPNASPTP